MTGLCAICASDGDIHRETLDGREVNACSRCADEHPRNGGYSFDARPSRDVGSIALAGGSSMGTRLTTNAGQAAKRGR